MGVRKASPPPGEPGYTGPVQFKPVWVEPSLRGSHVYSSLSINGRKIKRSRIVFALIHGRWPSGQIDHINGNSLDDRPSNLREATQTQNAWNHKKRTKRSPMPMGVRQIPSGRYLARIACNKTKYALGIFDDVRDAEAAYQSARHRLFGEFA